MRRPKRFGVIFSMLISGGVLSLVPAISHALPIEVDITVGTSTTIITCTTSPCLIAGTYSGFAIADASSTLKAQVNIFDAAPGGIDTITATNAKITNNNSTSSTLTIDYFNTYTGYTVAPLATARGRLGIQGSFSTSGAVGDSITATAFFTNVFGYGGSPQAVGPVSYALTPTNSTSFGPITATNTALTCSNSDFSFSSFGCQDKLETVLTIALAPTHFLALPGSGEFDADTPPAVPEPSSLLLLGSGLVGIGFALRRNRRRMVT